MTSKKRTALLWAIPAAVLCGVGVATQSRINGALGAELEDGFVAALVSFGSGLVILSLIVLFVKSGREGTVNVWNAVAKRDIPWWYAVGGAAGALFVLSQGLVSGVLGVALFSIGAVSGQTVSSIAIDRIGIGSTKPRPITAQRIIGGVLALAAVALAGANQLHASTALWLYLLPFIAGLGLGWQQGVNGQIRSMTNALTATFNNFLIGTFILVVATGVRLAIVGAPAAWPANPVLYIGGFVGAIFVALSSIVVGVTGVLLITLCTISGQLIMSIVLDLMFPVEGHAVAWTTFAGVALALLAVVIVVLSKREQKAAIAASDN